MGQPSASTSAKQSVYVDNSSSSVVHITDMNTTGTLIASSQQPQYSQIKPPPRLIADPDSNRVSIYTVGPGQQHMRQKAATTGGIDAAAVPPPPLHAGFLHPPGRSRAGSAGDEDRRAYKLGDPSTQSRTASPTRSRSPSPAALAGRVY